MSEETPRKVAIICSKGTLDMAYPGLIMANAARLISIDCMLFFTFWGLDIINKNKMDKLQVATVGNPSMGMPTFLGGIPGMGAMATSMMKKEMEKIEIPTVREMIEILDASGADLYACKMAMDMFKLTTDDLVPEVKEVLTATDFWEKAEGAQVVFV